MKRLIVIMMAAVLSVTLFGCGAEGNVKGVEATPTAAPVRDVTDLPAVTDEPVVTDVPAVTDEPVVDDKSARTKAGTITVGTDAATIEEAVAIAIEGDVIFVPKGIYSETVGIEKDGITFRGEEGTIFDGTDYELTMS